MYSPSRQHSRVLGVLTTLLTGETHFPWREQPAGGSTAFWGIMEKRGCLWPPAVRSIPSVCPPSPSPPGRSPFWQIIQGTGGWQANPQKWRLSERSTISRFEKRKYFEKSSRKLTQVGKVFVGPFSSIWTPHLICTLHHLIIPAALGSLPRHCTAQSRCSYIRALL